MVDSAPARNRVKKARARGRMQECTCPNSPTSRMHLFYRAGEIPAHSALMLGDAAEARDFPRRPMDLGFCRSCGHVCNVLFDPTVLEYSDRYEDQQSASKRFRDFQTGLVDRVIEDYDLRGKSVVEVGCGHADFLIELCRRGNNRGVGIDPRAPLHCNGANVRFIHEPLSPEHYSIPCDFLCCRHTLDHAADPRELVNQFRRYLLEWPDAILFMDVPDAGRIWREVAFWDLYYEHCSYFTAESLTNLVRQTGFDILEMDRTFDGQYLMIAARLDRAEQIEAMTTGGSLDELESTLAHFSARVPERIAWWQDQLKRLAREGRRAAVWGGSSKCTSFLSAVGCPEAIACVVDINPRQHGKYLPGIARQVLAPESLRKVKPDVVLVMNRAYKEEIRRDLQNMGLDAEIMAL